MTDIETQFRQFVIGSQLARSSCISMDSAIIPQWREVFNAGYRSGIESVGDVVIQSPEDVEALKKEISSLKGQITKLKKAK